MNKVTLDSFAFPNDCFWRARTMLKSFEIHFLTSPGEHSSGHIMQENHTPKTKPTGRGHKTPKSGNKNAWCLTFGEIGKQRRIWWVKAIATWITQNHRQGWIKAQPGKFPRAHAAACSCAHTARVRRGGLLGSGVFAVETFWAWLFPLFYWQWKAVKFQESETGSVLHPRPQSSASQMKKWNWEKECTIRSGKRQLVLCSLTQIKFSLRQLSITQS